MKREIKSAVKRKVESRMSMRVFFTLVIIGEIMLIIGGSWLLMDGLHQWNDITNDIPDVIWLLAFSICLASAIMMVMGRIFFTPIAKLRQAMRQVTEGDFTIRLKEKKVDFQEIRQITADFNLMVKELQATEILQTDFVSNVSHEFKTPINAIEGYATLLQNCSQPMNEEQKECVEEILENTHRLSSLIGNMLLLSKVDNQGIQIQKETYCLDEQIRQAILSLEHKWMEKNVDFDAEMEPAAYTGNEKLMFHVWSNLIDNAIKFGPENGMIRISLKKEQEQICVRITDEGPGIQNEEMKHIFDRFYQADSSHKEEGNGLGLALVKRIVHLEGGSVWAENQTAGCCFTVVLKAG